MILLFNSNNLVFHDSSTLEQVRDIPVGVLIVLSAVVVLAYLLRSFSTWRLLNRLELKGLWVSFLPFLRLFAYIRLGKEVGGFGPKTRLFYRFLSLVYLISLVLLLLAPSFKLMILGLISVILCYLICTYPLLLISKGICGNVKYIWAVPLIGSIAMLISVFKSRNGLVFVKPKNYDGLFKKVEDMEIVL